MSDFDEEPMDVDVDVDVDVDPYAYLDREDFTSEKFKIEIRGLPKFYGIKEFKKFLNEKMELNASKVKPPKRGSGWVYVCFKNEESRDLAISKLNNSSWKNATLTAHAAKPAPDPFIKRKIEQRESRNKKSKTESDEPILSPEERIQKSTIPLWNMPYEDQLKFKEKGIRSVLVELGQQITRVNKNLSSWLAKQKENNDGLICELKPILHPEVENGYRNKCEFTVGKSMDGKEIMVGFRLSSYAAGSTAIGPIGHLCHIPQSMKVAVKILEEFIKNSKLEVYNPVDHTGFWRQVTARTTRLNHLMLIVAIHPQNLTPESLDGFKSELKKFFEEGNGVKAGVTSLYFETINRKSTNESGGETLCHLSGSEYIEETLLGMSFRISPEAFFQVNTAGAEILYQAAIDLAQPTKDTGLLDVCCGTGTIGLCFSKYCGEVLGLEIIANAIKDARENAIKNHVDNTEFFVGKAEDILTPVIQRTTKADILAVVDPPRAGLHQKALLALRRTKKLKKMLYISCAPRAAIRNLVDLARPNSKQYSGMPLVPVKVVPVDMFPHTKHCELVIYLERLSQTED